MRKLGLAEEDPFDEDEPFDMSALDLPDYARKPHAISEHYFSHVCPIPSPLSSRSLLLFSLAMISGASLSILPRTPCSFL